MDSQTVRVRNTRVPHKKKLLTRLLSSASPLPLSKACSRWTRGSWPKMGWMCQQNPWIFLIAGLSLYFLLMDIRVNNMKEWKCKQEFYICESFISRPFQLFFQLVQPLDGSDISVKGVMQVSCSTIHLCFFFHWNKNNHNKKLCTVSISILSPPGAQHCIHGDAACGAHRALSGLVLVDHS